MAPTKRKNSRVSDGEVSFAGQGGNNCELTSTNNKKPKMAASSANVESMDTQDEPALPSTAFSILQEELQQGARRGDRHHDDAEERRISAVAAIDWEKLGELLSVTSFEAVGAALGKVILATSEFLKLGNSEKRRVKFAEKTALRCVAAIAPFMKQKADYQVIATNDDDAVAEWSDKQRKVDGREIPYMPTLITSNMSDRDPYPCCIRRTVLDNYQTVVKEAREEARAFTDLADCFEQLIKSLSDAPDGTIEAVHGLLRTVRGAKRNLDNAGALADIVTATKGA